MTVAYTTDMGFFVNGEATPRPAYKLDIEKWYLSPRFEQFIQNYG